MFYLPVILSLITWKERYIPKTKFGKYWVYNVFRVYERVFGREHGVRPESACDSKGNRQFFTLESFLMYCEGRLRQFKLPELSYERVYIPVLSPVGAPSSMVGVPYLLAIGAPTNNQASLTGYAGANPPVVSMTPSGSDTIMMWYTHAFSNGAGQTGVTASATFNTSESATSAGTHLNINNSGGLGQMSIWYRVAPTATTANATVTITNSQGGGALNLVVYSGVDQTTPSAGYNTNTTTSANANVNVTTTVANSYVTGFSLNNGVPVTAGTGMTARVTDGGGTRVLDSGNLATTQTFNWNVVNSSQPWGAVATALSPVASTPNSGFFNLM